MNLQTYSVSAIYSPPAIYSDPFYAFKQRRVNYDDGLSLIEINALSGVNSSSINNYTSQYLTVGKSCETFLRPFKQESPLHNITTTLIFNSYVSMSAARYMSISTTISAISATGEYSASVYTKALSSDAFDNSINFELEFINNKLLRVKHNVDSKNLYLNYGQQTDSLTFYSYISSTDPRDIDSERNDVFRYQLDTTGYLTLYKLVSGGSVRTLIFSNNALSLVPVDDLTTSKNNSVIRINYNYTLVDTKNSSSWVSYKPTKLNDLTPNNSKSIYSLNSQYLLHTNYNLESTDYFNLNLITLNNHRSEKGYVMTGTNLLSANKNIPDVEYREYTSLFTGNNQEGGNKNITLNYVFYNKDLVLKSGTDTFFKTPENMYPFVKLNINDSDFISNGSCGGPSPLVSDKIYVNRKYTTQSNNGRYLCTWLSAGSNGTPGVWLDRYYDDSTSSAPIIDFVSSLALEPNTSYKYERIGNDDINSIVSSSKPLLSGFNNYYSIANVPIAYKSDSIVYDGFKYNKYDVSAAVNTAGQFTVSFDLYINQKNDYGFQILGNKTNTGFGVRSDTIITPFIYTYQDNILYVYNTDHIQISTTKFDRDIRDVIPTRPLENFFVICRDGYVYKVDPLGNKIKLEIIPDLTAYKSYLQEDDSIIFLKNDTGQCIAVNNYTLAITSLSSTSWLSGGSPNSIFKYDNILYSIPGRKIRYAGPNSDILYYNLNDTEVFKLDRLSRQTPVGFAKINNTQSISGVTITDFNIDSKENVYIGYKNKIIVFGPNRQLITSVPLDTISNMLTSEDIKILDIDFVKEYKFGVPLSYTTALILTEDGKLGLIKFDAYNREFAGSYTLLPLSGSYVPYNPELRRYTQTNYQHLNLTQVPNTLKFELTLTNYLSSEEVATKNIEFLSSDIDEGFHNFSYRFDSIKGNITLFVDGVRYTNLQIPPGKYKYQTIFHEELFLGTLGFFNGIDLATYLKQPGQYYIKNAQVRNFLFYNKVLSDTEIYAINMFGRAIDDLVLAIPAGQRNNTEEIERLFKFSQTSSSNLVDVYIKNLKIDNSEFRQNIINDILSQAKTLLPAGVYINNIKFIDFK